ncbi:MAG: LptE family protein, partial [Deltaproteobacteria bacterium]|nr:LptE family protein [Deltaproteobacteria bacterium]
MKKVVGVVVWIALLGLGCGYNFVGGGGKSELPPDVQTVAIPIFANQTLVEGIESDITRALVEKFTSARRLTMAGEDTADAVLTGTVKAFVAFPITVTLQTQTTTEYRATVTLEFIFQRQKDKKILRKEVLSEWRNYPVLANLAATENNKKEAIRQIADLLAERVHEA